MNQLQEIAKGLWLDPTTITIVHTMESDVAASKPFARVKIVAGGVSYELMPNDESADIHERALKIVAMANEARGESL